MLPVDGEEMIAPVQARWGPRLSVHGPVQSGVTYLEVPLGRVHLSTAMFRLQCGGSTLATLDWFRCISHADVEF